MFSGSCLFLIQEINQGLPVIRLFRIPVEMGPFRDADKNVRAFLEPRDFPTNGAVNHEEMVDGFNDAVEHLQVHFSDGDDDVGFPHRLPHFVGSAGEVHPAQAGVVLDHAEAPILFRFPQGAEHGERKATPDVLSRRVGSVLTASRYEGKA